MPKEILVLGQGNVLTATTLLKGLPGIVLCNAPEGSNGTTGEDGSEHSSYVHENGVVILFSTMQSALRMLERIEESIANMIRQSNQENKE